MVGAFALIGCFLTTQDYMSLKKLSTVGPVILLPYNKAGPFSGSFLSGPAQPLEPKRRNVIKGYVF
jgi:hypothetical protein